MGEKMRAIFVAATVAVVAAQCTVKDLAGAWVSFDSHQVARGNSFEVVATTSASDAFDVVVIQSNGELQWTLGEGVVTGENVSLLEVCWALP
jgi:hypothetical protein